MTRREMLDRIGLVGAGLFVAPLQGKFGPDRDAELKHIAQNSTDQRQQVQTLGSMGYVVVTPQGPTDGGHFGPNTPDTKTAGIQEAFEYAKSERKDLYIAGGALSGTFAGGVAELRIEN